MDFGIWPGTLELRQVGGARVLSGRFNYNSVAVISDRGRVRKEKFANGAFNFAIDDPSRDIDILVGHEFSKPVASRKAGTLEIESNASAVTFEATLPTDPPSWVLDVEKSIAAGLMTGLSPGFRVPPASAVANAEELIPEPGNPAVMIRQVNHAVLREFSIVTAPAYSDAAVELRADDELHPVHLSSLETLWL